MLTKILAGSSDGDKIPGSNIRHRPQTVVCGTPHDYSAYSKSTSRTVGKNGNINIEQNKSPFEDMSKMKSPVDWQEQNLLDLITVKREENVQLDFKRADSLDAADKRKAEISKDVSAFANSAGGTIVYGISESSEEPRCAESLSPVDPSRYSKEWLEQVINSRIQPRIQGLLINPIELVSSNPGKVAYVVCIPQSATAHQASDHRYYKRYNFESVPMEDYEVRQTMARASRASYKVELQPSQIRDSGDQRYFQLNCTIENVSELIGRDVSAVLLLPKHLICQPDRYEVPIEGAIYSRISGQLIESPLGFKMTWKHPPLTPYSIHFRRDIAFSLSALSRTPIRAMVKIYDKSGLALTARAEIATPDLVTISVQEIAPL